MKIKEGVKLTALCPQMVVALIAVWEEYSKRNVELVITPGTDGTHSEKSKHYAGSALDFRVWNLPNYEVEAPQLAKQLQDKLGRDFLVLFEQDHFHIQYEPRRPT